MNNGFTLIEIVLVVIIIAIIVIGIFAGQDLIRQAELRKLVNNLNEYELSALAFKLKYDCIPADCTKAEMFLGSTNGNGDGRVGNASGNWVINPWSMEQWYFWEHLSLAGLTKGEYIASEDSYLHPVPNFNLPASIRGAMAWVQHTELSFGSTDEQRKIMPGNYIKINLAGGAGNIMTGYGPLIPEEAWAVDIKLDDGNPSEGIFISPWCAVDLSTCNPYGGGGTCTPIGQYPLNDSGTYTLAYVGTISPRKSGICNVLYKAGF